MKSGFFKAIASRPERHSLIDDIQGLLAGSLLAGLGVMFLSGAKLLSGGTAGVAFLLHYAAGWSFGLLFFLINLPFYYFAFRRMGPAFTIKTFLAVTLTSFFSSALPKFIGFGALDPFIAALVGGLLLGTGMLALFRHRASLGGFGILALFLQDRFGWRAGLVQLCFDCTVLALSFLVASPFIIACSVAGAAVLNLTLAINHRRDRYIAV
ncbi:YitT family protein [Allorhizobium sp. BGMRC 0089]|uniref:YitT family protein n=1 Tax=Allorhizobium sonneratiae TaxID=2934936 RepID=UPI00203413AC|nr:YitT family protein [Allorhizobium sonneratiae]MCM2291464.1 YitT family protein [Allorhizobium sonneratiae]